MIPFNYHHLYYFYCVAKQGSVSKAALEVRVSQPALSAQINQFETFLGKKLFERDGRNLRLTEEGQTAYAYAQTIFDAGREFMDSLRDRSYKGRLRVQIGVTNSVPKAFAGALLRFILNENPDAQILLHEDTLGRMVENLKHHVFDIVLSDRPYQASSEEKIQNRPIGKIPIVFCAVRRVASRYKRFPRDLDGAPLILPTAHSGVYHSVLEYLAAHKAAPNIVAEIQDVELIQRMVLGGAGIAPLNEYSITAELSRDRLVTIPCDKSHGIHDSAYLITRTRRKENPLVSKILEGFRLSLGS